jgi:hypothetical protein
MDSSVVYRKSGRGAARLAAPHGGGLTARERNVLILLDGQRTVADLSEVFERKTLQAMMQELEAKGLAKRVDPKLPDELAGAITQFRGGPHHREPAPPPLHAPRPEGHPLFWSVVILALTIWSGYWLSDRYERQAQTLWQFTPEPPVDWSGLRATDPVEASLPANVGPVSVAPLRRLPAGPAAPPPSRRLIER